MQRLLAWRKKAKKQKGMNIDSPVKLSERLRDEGKERKRRKECQGFWEMPNFQQYRSHKRNDSLTPCICFLQRLQANWPELAHKHTNRRRRTQTGTRRNPHVTRGLVSRGRVNVSRIDADCVLWAKQLRRLHHRMYCSTLTLAQTWDSHKMHILSLYFWQKKVIWTIFKKYTNDKLY